MAELRTDFKDDILAEAMEGRRRYQMIQNEDGTVSFIDVTEYVQMGNDFGQAEINEINAEINNKFDSDDVVDPTTATEAGFAADAKLTGDALRAQSTNIGDIWKKIYPVGSIYMSISSANPSTLFGGTWAQITGRFLLAAGGGYSAGTTGGEATHKLTVAEMPSHNHTWSIGESTREVARGVELWGPQVVKTYTTSSTGGNGAHNNMPPYLAVYMWRRTA